MFLFHLFELDLWRNSLCLVWHQSMHPCCHVLKNPKDPVKRMPIKDALWHPWLKVLTSVSCRSLSEGLCLDVTEDCLAQQSVVTVLWFSADNVALHFQVKDGKGKFQGSWQRSFEACFPTQEAAKPLVPEEMSNPAGISDIVILDMEKRELNFCFEEVGHFLALQRLFGLKKREKARRSYSFEKISFPIPIPEVPDLMWDERFLRSQSSTLHRCQSALFLVYFGVEKENANL